MLFVLYLATSLFISTQPEWSWSFHPESNFKVLTPYALSHDVKDFPTELEVIRFHQYHGGSVSDSIVSMAFVIDHYTLPPMETIADDAFLTEFFENTVDELLMNVDGTLIYMDIIHQPGREVCLWKGSYNKGKGIIRGNSMLYGNEYYGLQVFGLEEKKQDEMMSKFFDSFKRLTDVAPPTKLK
jgi:hypothetical protein